MRFVPIKTVEQQAEAVTHKARQMLIKQQTMTQNSLRGLMAEFGIVVPQGPQHISKLLAILADPEDPPHPRGGAHRAERHGGLLPRWNMQVETFWTKHPGPGPRRPDRAAAGHDPGLWSDPQRRDRGDCRRSRHFDSGRDFAASLGLVPRQDGTGGKVKLGPISKRGNGYLRRLLVNGATAVLNGKNARNDPWQAKLLDSKPRKLAAVALANKMARIAWAVMTRQETYRPRAVAAAA